MTKELEALERLKQRQNSIDSIWWRETEADCEILKAALEELEEENKMLRRQNYELTKSRRTVDIDPNDDQFVN